MKSELLNICTELVAAVANGLYQGLIITILVWLGLRVLGRTNAATRHGVWFLTLLLVGSLIPAHWAGSHWRSSTKSTKESVAVAAGGHEADWAPPFALLTPGTQPLNSADFLLPSATGCVQPQPDENQVGLGANLFPPSDTMAGETPVFLLVQPDTLSTTFGEAAASGALRHSEGAAAANNKVSWWRFLDPLSLDLATGSSFFRWASLVLVATWLTASGIKVTLVISRLLQLRALKRDAFPPSRSLETLFEEVRRAMRIQRRVGLRVSLTHRSPLLLGFCHPVILLGIDDSQPTEVTEHFLRHELAHARRHDDWANLFQRFVQSILPFHPSVWWISRQLSLEREIACDDWVLQHARRPRAYALLLADLAARFQGSPPLLAPGALTNNSQLKQRIGMILDTHRNASPRLAKTRLGFLSIAATLLALLAFYSAPRLVLAQTITAPPGPPAVGGSAALSAVSVDGAETIVSVDPTQYSDVESDDEISVDSLTPADVEPGPKIKPGSPKEPAPALAPVPPMAPNPGNHYAPALPPRIVAISPRPFALGQPAPSPDGPSDRSSIERRLDRLERMVQSLLAQRGANRDGDGLWKPGNDNENEQYNKSARAQEERARAQEDRARAQEERARAQAERAAKQMKEASEDIKRSAKESEMKQREEWRAQIAIKPGPDQELQALRKAREALGREIEHLDRQIERLEQQRSRLEHSQPAPDGKHTDQPAPEPLGKEHRS